MKASMRRPLTPGTLAALAALAVLLGAGGCGQKGPLYLPDPAPRAVPPAPGATPATTPEEKAPTRKTPRTPDPATAQ